MPKPSLTAAEALQADSPFKRFIQIIAKLRDPNGGCPWDLEQTHKTIRPYLIEESYEVLDAIDAEDDTMLCEELGDLLLQVALHSQIAADRGAFTIEDVVNGVAEKMIRRHPHVFGSTEVSGSGEVLKNWEQIKSEERKKSAKSESAPSLLDGIPVNLPALIRAQRTGEKATRVGFDWDSLPPVRDKVAEELAELDAVIAEVAENPTKPLTTAPKNREPRLQVRLEEELGDLLFSVCQLARWLGVGSEDALRGTITRFTSRFRHMEANSKKPLSEQTEAELDAGWDAAKAALKDT